MSKTVNDFIGELQQLKDELRELPVFVIAPNGIDFEPEVKMHFRKNDSLFCGDKPDKMIITF